MPLFSADIEKLYQGEYWTNRYILDTANMQDAINAANLILSYERAVTLAAVTFTRYRVSDVDPSTDVYTIIQTNVQGSAATGGEMLPLFNVVRVDFSAGSGRPSRKYLRGVLTENVINFNNISATHISFIENNYAFPLRDLAAYVDVDGQALQTGEVYPFVAMRQLRRGSRRRSQPIL